MGDVVEMDSYRKRFKARCIECRQVWIERPPLGRTAYLRPCPYCDFLNALEVTTDA